MTTYNMMSRRSAVILIFLLSATQMLAQSSIDRHSTTASDGWISCQESTNPNPVRGASHWIHYDLGKLKTLHDLHFWNINHPDYLDDGVKNIIIDVRGTGGEWQAIDSFTVARATGSSYYEGVRGIDLGGVSARHLLITALDNHGGGCFGLSEIKIYTDDYEPESFEFALKMCEQDGLYQNLSGGIAKGGTYSGRGVTDNSDETFDFDALEVGPGLHNIDYQFSGGNFSGMIEVMPCQHALCGGCQACPGFVQADIDGSPIPSGRYQEINLQSSGNVSNSGQVIFWGGKTAEMAADFTVSSSGLFEVDIRTCYENFVINGDFENGIVPWELQTSNGTAASITSNTDAYEGAAAALISVTQSGDNIGDVHLRYRDLSIESGGQYRIAFVAKADGNYPLNVRLQGESNPYTRYIDRQVNLKTHWQVFSFEFTSEDDRPEDIRIQLRMGLSEGDYSIDKLLWAQIN